jgi:hypothetical protein
VQHSGNIRASGRRLCTVRHIARSPGALSAHLLYRTILA